MPRPKRLHGRPGTRVVPENFEADHNRALVGTRTAGCVILAPTPSVPIFDPDLGYSVAPDALELFRGRARVQALTGEARSRIVGEQDQRTAVYRLAIDHEALDIPEGSTITFTQTNDAWLAATTLFVRNADLGTVRFERHLICVDDVSRPGAPT